MLPKKMSSGSKVAIVSLSSGVLGESFVAHELELGIKRLEELELVPVFMPNAKKGIEYIKQHPEARAEDLKQALLDDSIDAIFCAIGGDDTYRIIPYIFDDAEVRAKIATHPKIFMGFSDSTTNHLMLNKMGMNTFYGPAFLTDFAELDTDMLGYTKYCVLNLFLSRQTTAIEPSKVWYKERKDFSVAAVGTPREMLLEENGYISLCKGGKASGKLYGGCIDVIYNIVCPSSAEQKKIYSKYNILTDNFSDKILFLETSDNKPAPAELKKMLLALKKYGFFDKCQGVLFGKPQDEVYFEEYQQIIKEALPQQKVLYNLNFGHAYPRCILPYGAKCEVDFDARTVNIVEPILAGATIIASK